MTTDDAAIRALKDELVRIYGVDALRAELAALADPPWPKEYVNSATGRKYEPHNEEERGFVESDEPKNGLLKGGEGSGKTVAGLIKDFERLRRGMSGVLVSTNLEHFKKSVWKELVRWCPWERVIEEHQRMKAPWEPYHASFTIVFKNEVGGFSELQCGGAKESEIRTWEGPNVHFIHLDEMRHHKTAASLKTFTGRARLLGPNGEPPQVYYTTTPRKHWLYEYFGPLKARCNQCLENVEIAVQEGKAFVCPNCGSVDLTATDKWEKFKRNSLVITLLTKDNEQNLEPDFAEKRAQTLTETEARVLLNAEWEDTEDTEPFLPSMIWWDQCREDLPPLEEREPLLLVMDAATGRTSGESDCFGLLGITRHPDPERRHNSVAVRYARAWKAASGKKIDFLGTERNPGPEREVLRLCGRGGDYKKVGKGYNVKCIVADPYQLHDMMTRFKRNRLAIVQEFSQQNRRTQADTDLLTLIAEKRVTHSGDAVLREHLQNANRRLDTYGRKLRLVKRYDELKIDLAVCLSMGAFECLRLRF